MKYYEVKLTTYITNLGVIGYAHYNLEVQATDKNEATVIAIEVADKNKCLNVKVTSVTKIA